MVGRSAASDRAQRTSPSQAWGSSSVFSSALAAGGFMVSAASITSTRRRPSKGWVRVPAMASRISSTRIGLPLSGRRTRTSG